MINRRVSPKGCVPTVLSTPVTTKMLEGEFKSEACVQMKDIVLSKFDCNKRIDAQPACIFEGLSGHDVIVGCHFLRRVGLKMDFQTNVIHWMNHSAAMKDELCWTNPTQFLSTQDDDVAEF